MKVEKNMKNYEFEEWLDSNYLTADYTDEELDDLYKICLKNDDFQDKDLPFQYNNYRSVV